MAQSLFPFFLSALLNLTVYVDESRAPLLCEVEKPAIFPSLRVRIIPLKTSQILAPCSLTLGLTTGVNYTFCFHFFHQTAYCPVREHTHAVHNTFQVSIAAFRSLHISDTQPLWEENVSPDWWEIYLMITQYYNLTVCTVRLSSVGTMPHEQRSRVLMIQYLFWRLTSTTPLWWAVPHQHAWCLPRSIPLCPQAWLKSMEFLLGNNHGGGQWRGMR